MAQSDKPGKSDGEAIPENNIEAQQRLSAERLGRRMRTYRDHDTGHGSHYNNSINTIVEEQQKQTAQLQQRSAETKNKKTTKKSEKRDHSLSMSGIKHSKSNRPLDETEMDNAGKKQKLSDGTAVKSTTAGDITDFPQHNTQIKTSTSPIPSPMPTSDSIIVQQDLEPSLGDINLSADTIVIKNEEVFSLQLHNMMNEDISSTILTYLPPCNEIGNCSNENIDSNDETIFNNILNQKLNFSNNEATCSQAHTTLHSQPQASCSTKNYLSDNPNSLQSNYSTNSDYKLQMPISGISGQSDNIPASQTLKQMAEVHQTKLSPTSCARTMHDYNINTFSYPGSINARPNQMTNYNPSSIIHTLPSSISDFPQNRRQLMQATSPMATQISTSPGINPMNISSPGIIPMNISSPGIINSMNIPNSSVTHAHHGLKQISHLNQSGQVTMQPHAMQKKTSTSPPNQAHFVMNNKSIIQSSQVQQNQNGTTLMHARMQPDTCNRQNQVQPGIMPRHINPNALMKSQGTPEQANKLSQYSNSIPNLSSYNTAGPSVPSSQFCNGNNNIRPQYTCQQRMPVQNPVQTGPHQTNPYMPGQMINNTNILRNQIVGQNKIIRGPPPEYRQTTMMQHVGGAPAPQEVGQMTFHPAAAAAYRQNIQQSSNQTLPPNIKIMNPNVNITGFRQPGMQRNRAAGGPMNSMQVAQNSQNPNWLMSGQGMSGAQQSYQDSQVNNVQQNSQMMDQMAMHNTPVSISPTNRMNLQQCVQMVPRMRAESANIRHPMQMTVTSPAQHMQSAQNMGVINKPCQMQNHSNVRNMNSYSVAINNNTNHIPNTQMTQNMGNLSHGAMPKIQLTQLNARQNPIAMQITQTRMPNQMMHGNPDMMQNMGINSHLASYTHNMPSHNSSMQIPSHINGLPNNSSMVHHIPGNSLMHNPNPANNVAGTIMPQQTDIKTEPHNHNSQPATPNNEYEMMYNDNSFHALLK